MPTASTLADRTLSPLAAALLALFCPVAVGLGAGCSDASGPTATASTAAASQKPAASASGSASSAATAAATAAASASASASASATAAAGPCRDGMVEVPYGSRFCMSKTEVTVDQYRACVDAKKCNYTKPANPGCNWHDGSKGSHPMNCVGRTQAAEYCAAQGGRLPSVEEWEFASRDGEQRPYAWGTADPQREAEDKYWCWSGKEKRTGTCPVGSFPAGATKSGLLDMAGNVAEWATGGDVEEKSKMCGRAWDVNEGWKAMEKCPGGYFAEAQVPVIGFRCVAPL